MSAFEQAISGDKHKRQVDADFALFNMKGITGVPTFVVNQQMVSGAQKIDNFVAVIDKALAGGGPSQQAAGDSPARGADKAPVEIVWFGAYQERFTQKVAPTIGKLEKAYRGKIRLVWRNHPLAFLNRARPAANAAMEAFAQGKFWPMHDLMVANRHALERDDLLRYGREAGLDIAKLEQAIDGRTHKAKIDADSAAAKARKLSGVPSFLINGTPIAGAAKYEDFKQAIEKALNP